MAERFEVWCPDQGAEDARVVRARDAAAAAEEWARVDDWNSAEFRIVSGHDATVHVRDAAGVVRIFTVSGRAEPSYTAREVRP